jgi:hypothetical protein
MRQDRRDLYRRTALTLLASWAFTVAVLFGIYFVLRAVFGIAR